MYSKVSENFHNYFLIVVYIIFYDVKSKISSKFFDLNKTKNALFYLDFIKKYKKNDLIVDKKKGFIFNFSEYFRFKLNN